MIRSNLPESYARSAARVVARCALVALACAVPFASGCPEPQVATNAPTPCTEDGRKWTKRAAGEYKAGDLGEANDSVQNALKFCGDEAESHLVAGRIALARLDFPAAIKALDGVEGSEASSLRARAFWYSDDLEGTAEELSNALEDPDFKDPWAKPVRELAGAQGAGRHPFKIKEGASRLVEIKMPRDLGYALMVPIEIDGQPTMALAVTGVPELVLDSKARTGPGWVSVKFASTTGDKSLEMRDVPALVQDLTPYTSNQTVPIGALIGVNLLRRLHVTFDRRADQFIIRSEEPPHPPPTLFTPVEVAYVRGGGMVVRGTMRQEFEVTSGLWINTGDPWTLALPDPTWKQIGVDPKALGTYAGTQHGKITDVHVGVLDLGPVESVAGIADVDTKLGQLDIDTVGAMGVGFLTALRVTIADGGRTLWLETDPDTSAVLAPPVPGTATGAVGVPAATSSAAPAASTAAPAASTAKPPAASSSSAAPPKASASSTAAPPKATGAPPAPKASAK